MNELPPLPPGFTLDPPAPPAMPPLPPGFVLDGAPAAPQPAGGTDMPPMARAPGSMGQPEEPGFLARQGRNLMLGTQAVGHGIADLVTTPFNLANMGANVLLSGADLVADKAFGSRVPFRFNSQLDEKVANAVESGVNAMGVPTYTPEKGAENTLYQAMRFGTQGLLGGAGLSVAAKIANVAERAKPIPFADKYLQPYVQAPVSTVVGDVVAGLGAGTGLGASQSIPEEYRSMGGGAVGGIADLLAMLGGGIVGGSAKELATGAPVSIARAVKNRFNDPNLPRDPSTNVPFTRGQAEKAAREYQSAATDPAKAAGNIGSSAKYYRDEGLPMPTSGLMSDDIGLIGVEQGQRRSQSTRQFVYNPAVDPEVKQKFNFGERDQALQTSAVDQLEGLVPAGSRPHAFTERADTIAAERRGQAQADALAVQREQEARILEAQRVRADEIATAQRRADEAAATARREQDAQVAAAAQARADAVAAAQREAEAVSQARAAEAADVQQYEGRGTPASVAIDRTVRETRDAELGQSRQLFNDIDPTGEVVSDARPLAARATAIRESVSGLPPRIQAELIPGPLLDDLERLAPRIEQRTTTSPILDEYGAPIQRTEEVNTGGTGTMSFADMNRMRPALSAAEQRAQDAGQYTLADHLRALKDEITAAGERLARSGTPAGDRAAAALDNFQERVVPNFRRGAGGAFDTDIKRDRTGVATRPSDTAERFLTRPEDAQDLMRIGALRGTQGELAARAREWLFDRLVSTGVARNGAIDPARLTRWRNINDALLGEIPGLRDEVNGMVGLARRGAAQSADSQAALTAAEQRATREFRLEENRARDMARGAETGARAAARTAADRANLTYQSVESESRAATRAADAQARQVDEGIRQGPLGVVERREPRQAVEAVLGSGAPARNMRGLVAEIGSDPKAVAGLKNAVANHLMNRVTTALGDRMGQRAKKVFDQNREALAEVYTPEEMNRLQRAQKLVEPLDNLKVQATSGSATAERATNSKWLPWEVIAKLRYGMLKGGGMIANAKKAVGALKGDTLDAVERIQLMATFDPEVAQYLLTMKTAPPSSPGYNKALQGLLRKNEVLGNLTDPRDDKTDDSFIVDKSARPPREVNIPLMRENQR